MGSASMATINHEWIRKKFEFQMRSSHRMCVLRFTPWSVQIWKYDSWAKIDLCINAVCYGIDDSRTWTGNHFHGDDVLSNVCVCVWDASSSLFIVLAHQIKNTHYEQTDIHTHSLSERRTDKCDRITTSPKWNEWWPNITVITLSSSSVSLHIEYTA